MKKKSNFVLSLFKKKKKSVDENIICFNRSIIKYLKNPEINLVIY